jgi:hypothetical protein
MIKLTQERDIARSPKARCNAIVGQFDCGRIVNWKTGGLGRILGACQNLLVIDPVNAARYMTAANIW